MPIQTTTATATYEAFRRADAVWITTDEQDGTVRLRRGTFADSPEACNVSGWEAVEFIGYLGATATGVEFDEMARPDSTSEPGAMRTHAVLDAVFPAWTIDAAEFAAFINDPDFVQFTS